MVLQATNPHQITPAQQADRLVWEWQQSMDLRTRAGEISADTTISYLRGAQRFLDWCNLNPDVQARGITPETFILWKAELLKQELRPATINQWLAGVKSFFSWAAASHKLPYNPTEGVKNVGRKGTSRTHVREALTDLEIQRLLAQPDTSTDAGKRDLAILMVFAYTGARSIEVYRADLEDLKTRSNRMVLYVTGKGHSEAEEFVVLASKQAEHAMYNWLSVRGNEPGPLFTSLSKRSMHSRLSRQAIRALVKKYLRSAGIVSPTKTTHSLRHTAITNAIRHGVQVQKVQSMARHRNIGTTMIYYHEQDRLTDPAEDAIDYG